MISSASQSASRNGVPKCEARAGSHAAFAAARSVYSASMKNVTGSDFIAYVSRPGASSTIFAVADAGGKITSPP